MVRIIHTADIHLDTPLKSLALRDKDLRAAVEAATRAAFEKIIDTALAEQVSALIIAGDLFDRKQRSAHTAVFLASQLERLQDADIRVFYIKGNHDAENPLTGAVDLPDNVHVFSGRGEKVQLGEDVWIHGVSFTERHAPEGLLSRFSAPVPNAVNIALLHTSLAGAPGHDVYAPCAVSDLAAMQFDYWALGHVHKRQVHSEDPWIVMPGIPQGRDIGEAGSKSATMLTISDGKIDVTQIPTSAVEFVSSSLDITDVDSNDGLRKQLRRHMKGFADKLQSSACVVRLTLTGAPKNHWQILRDIDYWREQLAEIAREFEHLWIDKLILTLDTPAALSHSVSAIDELAAIIADIQKEESFGNTARNLINAVADDLPPPVRARLLSYENSAALLAQQLGRTGATQVLAKMKGADSQ